MGQGVRGHIDGDGLTVSGGPAGADAPQSLEDALDAVRRALAPLEGTPAMGAVVSIIEAAAASAEVSRSTVHPAIEAPAGTPDEALAVVAMLAQARTRLGSVEDSWMLEAAARIRAVNAAAGKAGRRLDDGVTSNIAGARRCSSHIASAALSSARRLARSMPSLRAAKAVARVPEATVLAITQELRDEPREVCEAVDAEIFRNVARLDGLGEKAVREVVADLVEKRTDPARSRDREVRAAKRRYLTITPQRHGMARLVAMLPAFGAAQIEAVVQAAAESARAAGSRVPLGALRPDMLVEATNYYSDALTREPPVEVDPTRYTARTMLFEEDLKPMYDLRTGEMIRPAENSPAPAEGEVETGEDSDPAEAADSGGGADVGGGSDPGGDADARPPGRPAYPPGPVGSARGPDLLGAASSSGRARMDRPAATPKGPRIELLITITDRALLQLDDGTEHASLSGYGLVPARALTPVLMGQPLGDLADGNEDVRAEAHRLRMFYRRLYTHPASGELVAMDSVSRAFPVNLRRMVLSRDGICRSPYCNAASRHADHIHPHAQGGKTSLSNGQGLCAGSNYDKDAAQWDVRLVADPHRPGGTLVTWVSPYGVVGSSPTPPSQRPPDLNRAGRRSVRREERLAARAKDRADGARRRGAATPGTAGRGRGGRGGRGRPRRDARRSPTGQRRGGAI